MTAVPLRLIDPPPAPAYRPLIDDGTIRPGDCWRDDFGDVKGWAVILPNKSTWHTWQPASDGICWDVAGEAPALTVSPSILDHASSGEVWHGWIRAGVMADA